MIMHVQKSATKQTAGKNAMLIFLNMMPAGQTLLDKPNWLLEKAKTEGNTGILAGTSLLIAKGNRIVVADAETRGAVTLENHGERSLQNLMKNWVSIVAEIKSSTEDILEDCKNVDDFGAGFAKTVETLDVLAIDYRKAEDIRTGCLGMCNALAREVGLSEAKEEKYAHISTVMIKLSNYLESALAVESGMFISGRQSMMDVVIDFRDAKLIPIVIKEKGGLQDGMGKEAGDGGHFRG